MNTLQETAPAFVEMAHRIVWCAAATVAPDNRPRSRVLHPIWQWDGNSLVGFIATGATPIKVSHLAHSGYISLNYWAPDQDTCQAECAASWLTSQADRSMVWDLFAAGPEPVGYDPSMIPGWNSPEDEAFSALRLDPWRLRVFPGTLLLQQQGTVLTWESD